MVEECEERGFVDRDATGAEAAIRERLSGEFCWAFVFLPDAHFRGEAKLFAEAALFERRAHLPAPAARQEAVRGTYDPTYGGYFLGKLAVLKLRRDYAAAHRSDFDLKQFHERVMTNGIAPWPAHRQILLPGDARPVIE